MNARAGTNTRRIIILTRTSTTPNAYAMARAKTESVRARKMTDASAANKCFGTYYKKHEKIFFHCIYFASNIGSFIRLQ